ncbi:unnamed protein product [Orchesella dallaii]|uniref:DNA/RNA non-specific endonuclease/pyrophosphatase/phosphodiesterase domain-containing protein n=1 Tax=Orchesella dallaii TaxID=48710 RepID=A0ABP1QBW2_9HEXA
MISLAGKRIIVFAFLQLLCSKGTLSGIIKDTNLFEDADTFAGETVHRVGTCDNNKTLVEIRFDSANPPSTLITVCHDEDLDMTLWAKSYIFGEDLENAEGGGNRPSFKEGGFYPTISTDDCYKQVTQTETIGMLVGSTSLAQEYVQTSKNLFLARGHLTPNGDPITANEKAATFYFINASPQWQTINGGNWVYLEMAARELAGNALSTFTVWTGSYGVTTLDDVNGNPVEIWLGRSSSGALVKKLPINHLTWKVIYDETTRTGVAVIQINNPWIRTVTEDDILCDDVCDQLSWVNWDTTDIVKGYTYCYTVASFKAKVSYAPDLGNLPLLRG